MGVLAGWDHCNGRVFVAGLERLLVCNNGRGVYFCEKSPYDGECRLLYGVPILGFPKLQALHLH